MAGKRKILNVVVRVRIKNPIVVDAEKEEEMRKSIERMATRKFKDSLVEVYFTYTEVE